MSEFEIKVDSLLTKIAALLTTRNWRMVTAESCTGGWIAKCCTDRAGSSAICQMLFSEMRRAGVGQEVIRWN